MVAKNSFIFINEKLSEEMQRLVCAHELSHAILYRSLGLGNNGVYEFEVFDITNQCEYDANVFAATLLLEDKGIEKAARKGYDVVHIARTMGANVNLIPLKLT